MTEFFHAGIVPTSTAQARRHNKSGATYLPPETKRARAWFTAVLEQHVPDKPMAGPIEVEVIFSFQGEGETTWYVEKPDIDNLVKLLFDAATKLKYWKDDKQIARMVVTKFSVQDIPGLYFRADVLK